MWGFLRQVAHTKVILWGTPLCKKEYYVVHCFGVKLAGRVDVFRQRVCTNSDDVAEC